MTVEPGPFRTDFLGRSGTQAERRIADYETTVGKTRDYFQGQSGKQAGDPQRAVEAIVEAVNAPEPPRHLLLGKIALQRFRKHLADWSQELDRWQDLTDGADSGGCRVRRSVGRFPGRFFLASSNDVVG